MFVVARIKNGLKRKISLILKVVILSAGSEDPLPGDYLGRLLEMQQTPRPCARSAEPDSREWKSALLHYIHDHRCFLSMNVQNHSLIGKSFGLYDYLQLLTK